MYDIGNSVEAFILYTVTFFLTAENHNEAYWLIYCWAFNQLKSYIFSAQCL